MNKQLTAKGKTVEKLCQVCGRRASVLVVEDGNWRIETCAVCGCRHERRVGRIERTLTGRAAAN
jgi:hypothetical protein